jgi:hypothetical protein
MVNDKNLIPFDKLTEDEQRKIRSSGGIASGASRRRRKALKETMDILLSLPVKDKRKLAKAVKFGFADDDIDNSALVVIALYEKAIDGDIPAIKELRSLIDESSGDVGQLEILIKALKNETDI